MKEIHDIRLQIYEETKSMTADERVSHTSNAAMELAKNHGITLRRPPLNNAV
jgi:hypothetical protein